MRRAPFFLALALLAILPIAADSGLKPISNDRKLDRKMGPGRTAGGAPSSVCGNGLIEGSEECDDNNVVSGDGCSAMCTIDVSLAHMRMWPTAIDTARISTLYNGGAPLTPTEAIAAYSAAGTTDPTWDMELADGTWTDTRGLLPAPTVTGAITFDARWQP